MKVLCLTRYGQKAASVRYRFSQYRSSLEQAGIELTISPLFDDAYLSEKFRTGRAPLPDTVRALRRRLWTLATSKGFDLAIIHYELIPYLPYWFEQFFISKYIPYVFDYDDAMYHLYDQSRFKVVRWSLSEKIASIISNASMVSAGSPYLVDYAKRFSSVVEFMPTVVDLEKYPVKPIAKTRQPFTIGWIGSPSTSQYVQTIAPALQEFCSRHNARVVLVGAAAIDLPGIPIERREWSEDTEIRHLSEFDVGIMPLDDNPWARGKCAFKLIQYMACHCPVIASPVGMNQELVRTSGGGLLATDQADWIQALTALYHGKDHRQHLGVNGRHHIEQHYSLQALRPRMISLLRRAADTG